MVMYGGVREVYILNKVMATSGFLDNSDYETSVGTRIVYIQLSIKKETKCTIQNADFFFVFILKT